MGGVLKYAQEKGWEISGAEINKDLLERARKYGLKNIYDANQEDDLPREKFDLIVAFDVLEHISKNEIEKYLKKWGDLLHPDGYFLARFPNGDSPFGLKLQNGDVTHINFIGSGMIKAYALNAGLEIVCLSGQAEPFMIRSMGHFLHRSLLVPFKLIMNKVINIIFYPNENIPFLSMNLIVIMKKINSK